MAQSAKPKSKAVKPSGLGTKSALNKGGSFVAGSSRGISTASPKSKVTTKVRA